MSVPPLSTRDAMMDIVLPIIGTLIAREVLAYAALTGRDGEVLADLAYEEVKLVGVRRRDVEQFWLELRYVTIARVIYTHCRLNWP